MLGVLWTVTEIFYCSIHQESEDTANNTNTQKRVSKMLSRIDMDTILFFLGILMAVGCLETIGVLTMLGQSLDVAFEGNHYLVTGIIGVLSSIVDNVPLVAGCMGMYPVQAAGDMARLCCRRGGHGIGEDHLRLVHEEDYVDSFRGLSGWHRLLLA